MLHEQILTFFSHYIESEIGVVYAQHNAFQLQNRLDEITKVLGVASVESLYQLAQTGITGKFKQLLLDVATNNETSFFRDPKVFSAVTQVIARNSNELGRPLRIWSAASSTGQEALSTAIAINEENLKSKSNIQFSIVGTDVSERALARATAAKYSQLEVQRGLTPELLSKYFRRDGDDHYSARNETLSGISYKKINLKDSFYFAEKFDFIFCRNVLIYQNITQKIEILGRVTQVLNPGGYLVLGSGESVIGLSDEYTTQNIEGAILYQKKVTA